MTKQQMATGRPKPPGPAYPNYSFRACLRIMEVVNSYGARKSEVPKSVIAQELKMGEDSSALYALIASAKCFGMVEGTRGLALTEKGERYCYPMTEHDQRQAELDFLNTPKAFHFIIDRYDGNKLPSASMLANLLITTSMVPKSWAGRVAGLFTSSATEIGVLDTAGYLRFEAATHTNGGKRGADSNGKVTEEIPQIPKAAGELFKPKDQPRDESPKPGITLWRSGPVRVETPEPMTKEIWSRLRKYVDSLEPESEPEKVLTGTGT
jgi:hypothetical protein